MPGAWFTQGGNIVNTPADAKFAISEIETPDDYDGVIAAIEADRLPSCDKAIVTTFGGLLAQGPDGLTDVPASQARARPIIDAGFACMTEVYARTQDGQPTGITWDSMEFEAVRLGWDGALDCYGVFGGAKLEDYPLRNGWSAWLAEYVL